MKKALAFFLICALCLPEPVLAAFASVGNLGTGNSTTSDNTLAFSPAATLNAGNLGVACFAANNINTGEGDNSEITTVVDSVGNTWTKRREYTNAGAAAGNVTVAVWTTVATTDLTTSDTFTATWSAANARKVASLWEFSLAGGNNVQVATNGDGVRSDDTVTDIGSIALSSLVDKEYLFFRCSGMETNIGTALTPTASFTGITQAEADDGGAITAQINLRGEFRIFSGTALTSDPACVDGGGYDAASIFIALEEVAAAGAACRGSFAMLGVGGC